MSMISALPESAKSNDAFDECKAAFSPPIRCLK